MTDYNLNNHIHISIIYSVDHIYSYSNDSSANGFVVDLWVIYGIVDAEVTDYTGTVIKSVKSIFSYTYNKIIVNPKQDNKSET